MILVVVAAMNNIDRSCSNAGNNGTNNKKSTSGSISSGSSRSIQLELLVVSWGKTCNTRGL